jgi:hypothetical protein
MNRLLSASAMALAVTLAAGTAGANPLVPGANQFCLYGSDGSFISDPSWGADCDQQVTGSLDPVPAAGPGNTLSSPQLFSGQPWNAHNIVTYAPGNYSVDTIEGGVYNFMVNPGQIGASMLFDWGAPSTTTPCGQLNCDIDVVMVWDAAFDGANLTLVSRDWDGDGIPGGAMIDGPFTGVSANFDLVVQGDVRPAPQAVDDNGGTASNNQTRTIDLVSNDVFYAPVTVTVCGTSADCSAPNLTTTGGGTLLDNGDGTVDYTAPAAPFTGTDNFFYTITDATGLTSAPATVAVSVTAATNTPPVANDVSFSTDEDIALVISVTDTDDFGTSVATDADGDPLRFATFTQGAQGGTVTVDASSTVLSYTPAADFNGTDSLSFTVNDGSEDSNVGTITISVLPVNDGLTCTDVNTSTPVDTALDIDVAAELLSTCTDPDGDTITLDSTTQPIQGGTLSFDGVNTLTYTPAPGFEGEDSFTYTATDGITTDTRTVSVTVGTIPFGNFTMLDAQGVTFGGTNDIVYQWDETLNTSVEDTNFNMTIASASNFPFFGFPWAAHNIRVFGPGSYGFDTTCSVAEFESGVANCGGGPDDILTLTVPAGQIGAHMLIDWNIAQNIDVIQLWEEDGSFDNPPPGGLYLGPAGPIPDPDAIFRYVSRDADGDGVPGARMIDGPFAGFSPNFNLEVIQTTSIPVTIDILPRKAVNTVNLRSQGLISVAVLTDSEFDAAEVAPETTRFGPSEAPATRYRLRDVDGDGDEDLLLFFRIQQTGIACGDSEASLTGETSDATPITGSDAIVTRNCPRR